MSEEKWNPSSSSEDFSLEDILSEFSTSYWKPPEEGETPPEATGTAAASPPKGTGRPYAEPVSPWEELLKELTLPSSLQPKPTESDAPKTIPELIVVPGTDTVGTASSSEETKAESSQEETKPELTNESAERENAIDGGESDAESKKDAESTKVADGEESNADGKEDADGEESNPDGKEDADGEESNPDDKEDADGEKSDTDGKEDADGEKSNPDDKEDADGEKSDADGKEDADGEESDADGKEDAAGEPVAAEGEPSGDEDVEAASAATRRRRSKPAADVPFQSDRVLVFLASMVDWFRRIGQKNQEKKVKVPRPKERPAPDTAPKELAAEYGKGLGKWRSRSICVLFMGILLLYPALVAGFSIPAPPVFKDFKVLLGVSAVLFLLVLFWSRSLLWDALRALGNRQFSMPLLSLIAVIGTIADAVTMYLGFRTQTLPLFAPVAFLLGMQMLGRYWDGLNKRSACRTATLAAEPYAVTLDYDQWDGEPSFRKHAVIECPGFGSQIQSRDGAQVRFSRLVPVLLVVCVALTLISTVAHHQPNLALWALSAYFTAASALTGCLCSSLPALAVTRRLSGLGAALAGWDGVEDAKDGKTVLLEDADLFPPGTITLQTFQTFEEFAPERVVSVAATLIRASGSGLDSLFHNLVRAEDGQYLNLSNFTQYPNGMTGTISDQEVYVGNAQFMEEMGVEVPDGFRVKNAVLCSLNLRLAGLFMLEYKLHRSIPLGVDALLTTKLIPVLLGRDFNLLPSMLRQKFKLPWDKMIFATPTQREKMAEEPSHQVLVAVLCREGMEPYAAAVAGAQRLAFATRVNSLFALLGSVLGIVLTFLLVSAGALNALSAVSLSAYLFLWLLPVAMLSGWVNQF